MFLNLSICYLALATTFICIGMYGIKKNIITKKTLVITQVFLLTIFLFFYYMW